MQSYIRESRREAVRQFIGRHANGENRLVVAASDKVVLKHAAHGLVKVVPGYERSETALILARDSGHKELFVDPSLISHRAVYSQFYDAIGVQFHEGLFSQCDSDHVFACSAALGKADYVMMSLISKSTNRSHGASIERRSTHSQMRDGVRLADLFELVKILDLPLENPKDPWGSIRTLVAPNGCVCERGYAGIEEANILGRLIEESQRLRQESDVQYAIETGQIAL